MSTWFNKTFLVKLEIKTDKLNFHSFRHTVSDLLKKEGVPVPIVEETVGHELTGTNLQVYHTCFTPKQKQDALEKLPY